MENCKKKLQREMIQEGRVKQMIMWAHLYENMIRSRYEAIISKFVGFNCIFLYE